MGFWLFLLTYRDYVRFDDIRSSSRSPDLNVDTGYQIQTCRVDTLKKGASS